MKKKQNFSGLFGRVTMPDSHAYTDSYAYCYCYRYTYGHSYSLNNSNAYTHTKSLLQDLHLHQGLTRHQGLDQPRHRARNFFVVGTPALRRPDSAARCSYQSKTTEAQLRTESHANARLMRFRPSANISVFTPMPMRK